MHGPTNPKFTVESVGSFGVRFMVSACTTHQ